MQISRFFSFIWKSLKALNTLVFGTLALLILVGVLALITQQETPEVPAGGALLLNPVGPLVEQKTAVDPTAVLQGGGPGPETLINDVLDALSLAADDERIALVVLDLSKFGGGLLPKLERVAIALDTFRESGKKVISIAANYNQADLLLAAHTDEVLLNPEGTALIEGFGFFRTYYHTLLQNFDVSVNLFKVGKYKSAVEPYFRDSMSEEDKESRRGVLDKWWSAYTANLESGRKLEPGTIDRILNDVPAQLQASSGNLGQVALATGMVDRLVTRDARRDYFIELVGEDEEKHHYRHIPYGAYLALTREPTEQGENRIAVITAVGTIIDGEAKAGTIGGDSVSALIQKARREEGVKAIVLRVDSGGGSKSASEIIRRELESAQEAGIPVVASMSSVAASGGYWVSATADEIWALPTTITGSIGIFGFIPTFEKTLARYGVHGDGVGTTPVAGGLSVDRGISPVMAQVIQAAIEDGYQQFLNLVAGGRNMTPEAVHEVAQGRVWSGEKAKELGLVDQLGDIDQAVEAAARLAGVEEFTVWDVAPDLSASDKILQELMSGSIFAPTALSRDPITQLTSKLRRELTFLQQLNDPNGAYVLCGACPSPASGHR